MLAENLILLRNMKGMSQEQIAEVIGISRQSYAKWEQGETVPDIEKCDRLAKFYDITIDALLHQENTVGNTRLAPAPPGKHLWGTVTIGSKGQIVIPKAARDIFNLNSGDRLIVLGDEAEGIALVKAEEFEEKMRETLRLSQQAAGVNNGVALCAVGKGEHYEVSKLWKRNERWLSILQQRWCIQFRK